GCSLSLDTCLGHGTATGLGTFPTCRCEISRTIPLSPSGRDQLRRAFVENFAREAHRTLANMEHGRSFILCWASGLAAAVFQRRDPRGARDFSPDLGNFSLMQQCP